METVAVGVIDFDITLTPEERAAPTFTEWSDATLARAVRALADRLRDSVGFEGLSGMAAALALEKIACDHNAKTFSITIDNGTRLTCVTRTRE